MLAVVGPSSSTFGFYGVVAIIVKADDVGLAMTRGGTAIGRAIGRALVRGMPALLKLLAIVGTAAMIWVGGGILLHGLERLRPRHPCPHLAQDIATTPPGGRRRRRRRRWNGGWARCWRAWPGLTVGAA